jgi:hypothetical protein
MDNIFGDAKLQKGSMNTWSLMPFWLPNAQPLMLAF